jgi:hypothetical protein
MRHRHHHHNNNNSSDENLSEEYDENYAKDSDVTQIKDGAYICYECGAPSYGIRRSTFKGDGKGRIYCRECAEKVEKGLL